MNKYLALLVVGLLLTAACGSDPVSVAEQFQVFSIPTLILFSRGREADRIVGLIPKKSIETVLKKYLG